MSIELDELYTASFKQVQFLVTATTTIGGRKDVLHQYPNSSRQTVEDLGALPRSFTLTAVLTGDTYFQTRNNLLTAIEDGGTGVLIHPFYGEINDVVARNYTLSENMASLGAASITIQFDIDTGQSTPIAETNTVSELNSLRDTALDSAAADIAGEWEVTTALSNSFEYGREKLEEFSTAYEEAIQPIQDITNNVNNITSLVTDFNDEIIGLVRTPQALSDSIKNLFATANTISQSAQIAYDSFKNLFGFGDSSTETILPDAGYVSTVSNIQKTSNKRVLDASLNQMALSQAYVNSAQLTYQTVDEIDEVISVLKAQSEIEQNTNSSSQTKDDMKNLQTKTFDYLYNLRDDVQKTVILRQDAVIPVRVLSYSLYSDSSKYQTIVDENQIKDVTFVSGTIKVLSE